MNMASPPSRDPAKDARPRRKARSRPKAAPVPAGIKVAKFGGSSLATAARIARVADIVLKDPSRRFVVLSAPGKAHKKDEKITDLLIQCAQAHLAGETPEAPLKTIRDRYREICGELGLPAAEARKALKTIESTLDADIKPKGAYMDAVKAMGEETMAQIFAAYLSQVRKVPAAYAGPRDTGLVVSEHYGDAIPLPQGIENLARSLPGREGITVYPGFYGVTSKGLVATFSRGGSDLTGALIAEAVDAEIYENWTDVDGILRADPTTVQDPELIPEITFREIRELSYMGFSVIHHEAVLPVRRKHIPVNLRNVGNVACHGTMIVDSRVPLAEIVVGVAVKKGFCCFNVEKYLMNREVGFGRRLLSILEDFGLSYEHMPSGIDSVSVFLDQSQLKEDMASQIIRRMFRDLEAERVEVEHDKAMVIAVGEGMKHHIGVCARLVTALARNKINIEVINQGASELSILFGVRDEDAQSAVRAIYDDFFAKQDGEAPAENAADPHNG